MQPPLFSGVLVMPKYENPAKKKVNFLQDSLCYWYRLFFASHRKTAESRRNGGQNHEDDRKDNHSIHKVCHGLYNADRESQIHTEAVKQLHQHSGAGGSNSTENNHQCYTTNPINNPFLFLISKNFFCEINEYLYSQFQE